MTVSHGRLELPILHRLDGFFVEAHAQAAEDANIGWAAVDSHDQAERADALVFGLARFLRKLRLGCINRPRRRSAAAHVEDASTRAATLARAKARAVTGSDAAATA